MQNSCRGNIAPLLEETDESNRDFQFYITKTNGKMDIYCPSDPTPIELVEVVTNVINLVPSGMRASVCDWALASIKQKERRNSPLREYD